MSLVGKVTKESLGTDGWHIRWESLNSGEYIDLRADSPEELLSAIDDIGIKISAHKRIELISHITRLIEV